MPPKSHSHFRFSPFVDSGAGASQFTRGDGAFFGGCCPVGVPGNHFCIAEPAGFHCCLLLGESPEKNPVDELLLIMLRRHRPVWVCINRVGGSPRQIPTCNAPFPHRHPIFFNASPDAGWSRLLVLACHFLRGTPSDAAMGINHFGITDCLSIDLGLVRQASCSGSTSICLNNDTSTKAAGLAAHREGSFQLVNLYYLPISVLRLSHLFGLFEEQPHAICNMLRLHIFASPLPHPRRLVIFAVSIGGNPGNH